MTVTTLSAALLASVLCVAVAEHATHQMSRQFAAEKIDSTSNSPKLGYLNCTEHYFQQRIDHFHFTPTSKASNTDQKKFFEQRYLVYDKSWQQSEPRKGPIFFYGTFNACRLLCMLLLRYVCPKSCVYAAATSAGREGWYKFHVAIRCPQPCKTCADVYCLL